jgi:hypothetical protein
MLLTHRATLHIEIENHPVRADRDGLGAIPAGA